MTDTAVPRTPVQQLRLGLGKETRLRRIIHQHGLGNGTAMVLSYEQGFGQRPQDFLTNPAARDPRYIVRLAVEGRFNALALQIGMAERFYWEYAGEVPLVLQLTGHAIPSSAEANDFPLTSTVEDAVRLGADAVGCTLHVDPSGKVPGVEGFSAVRRDAERFGMPLVVWARPLGIGRGPVPFQAVDCATRAAAELGADVINVDFPDLDEPGTGQPEDAASERTAQEAVEHVIVSACQTPVMLASMRMDDVDTAADRVRQAMEAGAFGVMFGRNVWQRTYSESLAFVDRFRDLLVRYPL